MQFTIFDFLKNKEATLQAIERFNYSSKAVLLNARDGTLIREAIITANSQRGIKISATKWHKAQLEIIKPYLPFTDQVPVLKVYENIKSLEV